MSESVKQPNTPDSTSLDRCIVSKETGGVVCECRGRICDITNCMAVNLNLLGMDDVPGELVAPDIMKGLMDFAKLKVRCATIGLTDLPNEDLVSTTKRAWKIVNSK